MINFDFTKNIILQNDKVVLRPLEINDFIRLYPVLTHPDIWRFTVTKFADEKDVREYIENSLSFRQQKSKYPFTLIEKTSGGIIGTTSLGSFSLNDKRVEIGWTYLGKDFHGTGLNRNCKYLLLKFLFDEAGFNRVEFKTDVLNLQSRKALHNIGAVEEGILRSHTVNHDGRRRNSVYYSILKDEWNNLKETVFKNC